MKHLLLKTWLVMVCLLMGVGTSWAEEVVSYTFATAQSGSNTGYAQNYDITIDNVQWSCPGNQQFTGYVRIGGKSLNNVTRNITSKGVLTDDITKVVLNHNGVSNSSFQVSSITLTVASDADFQNNVQTLKLSSPSVSSPGSLTFSPTSGTWGANKYYKISFVVSNSKASNYGLDVASIVFYKETVDKTIKSLAVSGTPTKTTYNVGDAFDPTGLVVKATYTDDTQAPITEGFDWEIDYGQDNTALVAGATSVDVMAYTENQEVMSEIYTVSGLTVTVPVTLTSIAVSGTPTKTAYYDGDAFETAGLVVTGHYSDGSEKEITEGIEWTIDPATLSEGNTSVSVVASVGNINSSPYIVNGLTVTKPAFTTVTYNFSSFTSGTTVELTDLDGFVITLEKNSGSSNPAWSSNQARVYAKGSLTVKANNATIKSIEYTYALNAGGKNNVTPTIDGVEGTKNAGTWDAENKTWSGSDEEVTFSTSGSAGNIGFTKLIIKYVESEKIETSLAWSADAATVTINGNDNVFPTLATTPVDLEGVTYESSNTAVATIAADGTITLVKEGETTITANYAGDAEHASASPASYTLTVVKAPFVPTPVAEGYETVNFASLYSSVTTNATVEDYEGTSFAMSFAKPESSTTPTKYYNTGASVRAYTGNTITIVAAENIACVNINWTAEKGEDTDVSITGLNSETAIVTFSKTCSFDKITVCYGSSITLVATDDEAFYATFSSDKAVKFDGATSVYAVSVNNGALSLNEVESKEVPANTGVLVKTSGTTAAYHYVPSAAAVEGNMLYPASKDKAELANHKFYMLGYKDNTKAPETLGFYWGVAEGAAFISRTGSAYLAIPADRSDVRGFSFRDTNVTGIEAMESVEKPVSAAYNLQGQRVKANAKGIVIMNGKKYFVK